MGRPSVAGERRRHILAATIRCIAAYGIGGTTLDRIAEEAGMARGHVRHFAGNRDEILVEAARAFYFEDQEELDQESASSSMFPPTVHTVTDAVDYLFGELAAPGSDNVVALAFVEAARSLPSVHSIVVEAYSGARTALGVFLADAYPDAAASARSRVAYGVFALALGNVFMVDVGVPGDPDRDPRGDAELLIATLA